MKSQFCLIIDFDSTLISVETLEYLADISIKNSYKKKELVKKISHYTNLAMNGEITFEESLDRRFDLMQICRSDINNAIKNGQKEGFHVIRKPVPAIALGNRKICFLFHQ